MVKRSIEQEIRNKNFGTRSGNFEKNAVVKNQGTTQRVQRILGDCWQWETNGQCVKGNNCSFRQDMNKRGEQDERNVPKTRSPEEEAEVVECFDCHPMITSKEPAPNHSVKSGTLQNACSTRPRVVADLGKSALMRIARLTNSLAKGLKRMVTKVQWPC